jgi:hypothetical protein
MEKVKTSIALHARRMILSTHKYTLDHACATRLGADGEVRVRRFGTP